MTGEKKHCRRCHKKRKITNIRLGWCRACLAKVNDRYCHIKILPHPASYDELLNCYAQGWSQVDLAEKFDRSRTGVQGICARYTLRVDEHGEVRPR